MTAQPSFVDIHCHLLPGIDDGASNLEEALEMAHLAVADGISDIVVTPHQLGNFQKNDGELVRTRVREMQSQLDDAQVQLRIHPGGDVRIEEGMIDGILAGDVLTLADKRKHILLELPHELYYPIEGLVEQLAAIGIQSILSHPERNQGILRKPEVIGDLISSGCLMQVTAGSLVGTFGPTCQHFAEMMLSHEWIHFLATDAHGVKSRRPLLSRAFRQAANMVGVQTATELCLTNPRKVVEGAHIAPQQRKQRPGTRAGKRSWLQRLVSA